MRTIPLLFLMLVACDPTPSARPTAPVETGAATATASPTTTATHAPTASPPPTTTTTATPTQPPQGGQRCKRNEDCKGGGQECLFEPGSCGGEGTCGTPVMECVVANPHCGCDNKTFFSCPHPTRPFKSLGKCENAPADR